ncbi:alpha/beta fold hydrolase [Streptomyces sp. A3M-1-3]|uniref:alpha/beta fold hydrolase n=1 Tax=Streptomyces sp. A3M-1-3 TaxID=2962044 RepID=UPI0020B72E74|nr:alpha/beta fold hydrolase [Streptomyces sp. A3M-1-3]MCP3818353.1 alpha/beta fold hydrolase [Streptomyces sp. A3M-1-3]
MRQLPKVAGVRHRMIDVRGTRLHLAEAGEGEPVLLLHGFPQHWYAWRKLIPQLAGEYRLICLDQRGFGWSDAPARGYGTDPRVDDVLALLDALGLERVRLIGHDWGAWTGFHLCLRAPHRISHYLALNMMHPWPLHRRLLPQAWRFWYTAILEQPLLGRLVLARRPSVTRWLLHKGVADRSVWEPAAVEEFVRSTGEPDRARAGEALHRAFALRDIARLLLGRYRRLRLTTPTVLLGGERDFVLPPGVLSGAGRHADALRIEVVEDCGHLLHEERPDLVARRPGRSSASARGRAPSPQRGYGAQAPPEDLGRARPDLQAAPRPVDHQAPPRPAQRPQRGLERYERAAPQAAEDGEQGAVAVRDRGHAADHVRALHQAPPRPQHDVEHGPVTQRAVRATLFAVRLAGFVLPSLSHVPELPYGRQQMWQFALQVARHRPHRVEGSVHALLGIHGRPGRGGHHP